MKNKNNFLPDSFTEKEIIRMYITAEEYGMYDKDEIARKIILYYVQFHNLDMAVHIHVAPYIMRVIDNYIISTYGNEDDRFNYAMKIL